jgi:hypothetical protein
VLFYLRTSASLLISGTPIIPTSPTTTEGDLIYRGASEDDRLPIGNPGEVLTVNNGGDAPEWAALAEAGWVPVEHNAVSGAANFTINGLTGNTDKVYKLVVKGYFNTAESLFHLRFNADTGSNYHYSVARHGLVSNSDTFSQSSSGALTNNKEAYGLLYDGSYKEVFLELLIDAKSGFTRKAQGKLTGYADVDNWTQQSPSVIWTNTADELTSIRITAGQNFLSGSEYWLFKI